MKRYIKLIEEIINNNESKELKKEYHYFTKSLEMNAFERDLIHQGFKYIAGVDEVGRGPLAGPVVSCAIILPKDYYLNDLNDSKKLSKKKRESLFEVLTKDAISYSIGISSVEEIDQFNIYQATKYTMLKALEGLKVKPEHLLIDAMTLDVDIPQTAIIKGDLKSASIAAASIIAKVTRDAYMLKLHEQYPEYKFDSNSGYGTKEHMEAIYKYGITPHHRKSFEPIKTLSQQTSLFD